MQDLFLNVAEFYSDSTVSSLSTDLKLRGRRGRSCCSQLVTMKGKPD